ncbi:tail tape measure protein, partial [Paraclostridium bifermentans]|uniref:phage tail protein n=4 Tax=Paraclostridium TaxID=1849822 RepID=UPI003048311B|nr:tail tape measure protein [Paraclostridium bifermentans]
KVVNWGSNLWNAGKNAAKRLVDAVVNTVKSIPGQMVSIGRNIVEGVWKGITGAAGWFKSKVNSFFGGIVDGAKAALGIHSPARKMIPVGQYTVEGTEVGMSKQFPKMQDKFKDKVHGLVSEMKAKVQYESTSLGSSIVSKGSDLIITNRTSQDSNSSKTNESGYFFTIQNILDSTMIGEATYKIVDNKLALAGKRRR